MISITAVRNKTLVKENTIEPIIKRKSGGQPYNQNARKHGLYSKVLSGDQKRKFKYAIEVDGIDEEIAIIRIKFGSLVAQEDSNMNLINQTAKTLGQLQCIKSGHTQNSSQLKAAVEAVLSEWEIPCAPSSKLTTNDDSKEK